MAARFTQPSLNSPSMRGITAVALRKIANEATVPALVQALKDKDSAVRKGAAYVLGDIGNEAAVPALLQTLSDEDSAVRSSWGVRKNW